MALKLVQVGLSGAAMFGPDRQVLQPSEVLRKKAILVERGSFRPPTVVNIDMLEAARAEVRGRPRGRRARGPGAHRAHDGQPARRRRRRRPAGLPGPRRPARGLRDDRADLRLPRLPPAGRLPRLAHRRPDRDGHGRPEPASTCSTSRTTPTCPAGSWRASAGCSRTTCGCSSIPMLRDGDVVTVDTRRGRRRTAAALRLPVPARQLRGPRQLQARVPADPQPRRAASGSRRTTRPGSRWCPPRSAS